MTAATLTRLPLAAGGAVLEITGNAIHWGLARYMRAPLANTAILSMVTLTAMAGSNALYMQRHAHPSPLFAPVVAAPAEVEVMPVVPATRRRPLQVVAPLPDEETTGSVPQVELSEAPISNAEVTEIQRKLHAMQIYEGAIDGLYGPRTARAIKTFEQRAGLRPKGELTRELLEAVRTAPVILPEPERDALPTPDPLPKVTPPKATSPRATPAPQATAPLAEESAGGNAFRAVADKPTTVKELAPLPKPAPLVADVEPDATRPHRELPDTPEEAFDIAVETAGDAIDTIISGVQSIAMTTPGKKKRAESAHPFVAATPAPPVAEPETDPVATASVTPQVGVPLAMPEETEAQSSADVAVLDTDAKPEDLMPPFSVTDPVIVAKVQRGLASLGFLQGPADGIAGEATAKAIRNFEVYFNYNVTGRISPELLDLLVQNGASI